MGSDSVGRSFDMLRLVDPANEIGVPARPRLDDQELVASVQAGDPRAASYLCDRLWPKVDATVRRLLGRFDSDQEDLAQISLIEIVNTIGNYRGDCSLDRWAQTITAHAVFKHIRRRNLERRLFSELLADDHHAGPVQVERMSVTRQLLERVAVHLDKMNVERVWAFLLHDVMGYDLHEIAEMTGTSIAAAQSRLSRGRRDLHNRVGHDSDLIHLLQGIAGKSPGNPAEGQGQGQGED